ncbi:MAG: hypothetical protein LBB41_04625, partial [Prevotellaceae bacterium]|nr:hypothetical protein [Prevotellaceae bacterium]
MKTIIKIMLFFALIINAIMSNAQPVTHLPYNCTFENEAENAVWRAGFLNRAAVSTKWVIDAASVAVRSGSKSMYVSDDGGLSASYTENSPVGYRIVAVREFDLPAGTYDFSFNWKSAGKSSDALRVAWMPVSVAMTSLSSGGSYWNSSSDVYAVTDELYGSTQWKNVVHQLNIPVGNTENYKLVFAWKAMGAGSPVNPGICIDNVQIGKRGNAQCFGAPSGLSANRIGSNVNLAWQGTAPLYEIEYFNDRNSAIHTDTSATNYKIIPTSQLPEGIYTFRVRSICNGDTSIFIERTNLLVFDPGMHCFDYLDISDANCWVGRTMNPKTEHKKVDFGYESKYSRQTIHYIPGETDERTGGMLSTKPEGAIASIRLGNWEVNDSAEVIEYKYIVDSLSTEIIRLNYAMVLQDPSHTYDAQPKGDVNVYDQNGVSLGACASAVFVSGNNTSGSTWHQTTYEYEQLWYSDWRTVAFNLRDYAGDTLIIRLISSDCTQGGHFGYMYFTIDCASDELVGFTVDSIQTPEGGTIAQYERISCGEKPERFEVAEGFNYRWYRKFDPSHTVLGTSNIFELENPNDTATYCVDMIFPEDNECFFTFETSAMARFPSARPQYEWKPENCENKVVFDNSSGVFGYYVDSQTGLREEKTLTDTLSLYVWDFGDYGIDTVKVPTPKIFPNAGDTVEVTLHVEMSDGGWVSDSTFTRS